MNKYYVYAHIDEETRVPFYIGMGKDNRAYDNKRNDFWVSFVEKYAPNYEIKFLAKNISQDIAHEIEHFFIAKLGKILNGKGILLNWTDGGFAEGAYIKLSPTDTTNIEKGLTEFGTKLLVTDVQAMNLQKIHTFLKETIDDKITELREKTILEINKKSKPRNSWIIPFCISEKIKKRDELNLLVTDLNELKSIINQPIKIEGLPNRPHTDFLIHRIMIYFDLILQENVRLKKNGTIISKTDEKWYFYKDYWKGYIKIIQALNRGLELEVNYIGRNKKDQNRKDIYDFEIKIK